MRTSTQHHGTHCENVDTTMRRSLFNYDITYIRLYTRKQWLAPVDNGISRTFCLSFTVVRSLCQRAKADSQLNCFSKVKVTDNNRIIIGIISYRLFCDFHAQYINIVQYDN
ncbi:hypothetical protein TSAR_008786 [Trichomalopsis sarcophagae]|uniref:Uncharacterized protein n=1 Tax=Trichomalopsis sarcophagae TaxID=543379 RepID=A0A232EJY7_9HYME|nr:hypothetical protein TSAR_008786 [Trichomalopsis sarcophagae]